MIALSGVWSGDPEDDPAESLIRDLSCEFPDGLHTGILAAPGKARGTLLRLMNGSLAPAAGEVWRTGRVSWIFGGDPGFHNNLTARENLHFLARVYGEDIGPIVDFCLDATSIGDKLDQPFGKLSAIERTRVVHAACLAMPFDFYLGEETFAPNDAEFAKVCAEVIAERMKSSTFIAISRYPQRLTRFQERILILDDGKLWAFRSLDDAALYFTEMTKRQANA